MRYSISTVARSIIRGREAIKFPLRYEKFGQTIVQKDGSQFLDVRGWGSLSYSKDLDPAVMQDSIGEWVAETLNSSYYIEIGRMVTEEECKPIPEWKKRQEKVGLEDLVVELVHGYNRKTLPNNMKEKVLDLIAEYGGIDGSHHKQWLLDEIVRVITMADDAYEDWVERYEDGEDGPKTYEWDKGIAP